MYGSQSLCTPHTEVDQQPVARSIAHPCCLGGYQRLEVKDVKHEALYKLGLDNIPFNPQQGLVGEDNLAFAYGENISPEPELTKVLDKFLPEAYGFKILAVFIAEPEILQDFKQVSQSCKNNISSFVRVLAEKIVKINPCILFSRKEVTLCHCQLIMVSV